MAARGVVIDTSVFAPGQGPGEVSRRVLDAFGDDDTYRAASVGSQKMQFARTYRPTWAIVVGIAFLPLAGLGALFFLVKTTETCVVVISEDHRGTTLHLRGQVLSATAGKLKMIGERRRSGTRRAESPTAATRAVPKAEMPAGGIVAAIPGGASPAPPDDPLPEPPAHVTVTVAEPVSQQIRLVFDTGEDRLVDGCALVGRYPENDDRLSGPVALIAIDDPDRSVSRTHLTVVVEGTRVWVVDRGSTNGTSVIDQQGTSRNAAPGEQTEAPVGSTVRFGERVFQVMAARAGAQR